MSDSSPDEGDPAELFDDVHDQNVYPPQQEAGNNKLVADGQEDIRCELSRATVRNPLWKIFLDSEAKSATLYFNIHLSSQSYFHSPTPWNPSARTRISSKVSQFLDSFRPGSTSYRPFHRKSPDIDLKNNEVEDDRPAGDHDDQPQAGQGDTITPLVRLSELIDINRPRNQDHDTVSNGGSNSQSHSSSPTESSQMSPEEENRRRLYLNLGRPRPFYRSVSDQSTGNSPTTPQAQEDRPPNRSRLMDSASKKKEIIHLQKLARQALVRYYGIAGLVEHLRKNHNTPGPIRDSVLTLPCDEFKELEISGLRSASYTVRSTVDGKNYTAVYATSEMDKAVSNVWSEERHWLELEVDGLLPVLCLAVDPPTQNIFYILPSGYTPIRDMRIGLSDVEDRISLANGLMARVKKIVENLSEKRLSLGWLREANIFVNEQKEIFLENGLLVKNPPICGTCSCTPGAKYVPAKTNQNAHKCRHNKDDIFHMDLEKADDLHPVRRDHETDGWLTIHSAAKIASTIILDSTDFSTCNQLRQEAENSGNLQREAVLKFLDDF